MTTTAKLGTGATLEVTGAAAGFFAEILDITPPSISRPAIKTSHMLTLWDTYIPGELADPGEMSVKIAYDPSLAVPIDEDPNTVVITLSNDKTWTFTGFLTNLKPDVPLEDRVTATVTIKATGGIVVA